MEYEPLNLMNGILAPMNEELRSFSDDELLIELRRRGRFGRLVGSSVARDDHVRLGFSEAHQFGYIASSFASRLAESFAQGERMPGYKSERGRYLWEPESDPEKLSRRVEVVLNYVIEKPKGSPSAG